MDAGILTFNSGAETLLGNIASEKSVTGSAFPLRRRKAFVLKMRWRCDACRTENVCDVSIETHFFAAILMAKREHAKISPGCQWDPTKIRGWLLHSNNQPRDSGPRAEVA